MSAFQSISEEYRLSDSVASGIPVTENRNLAPMKLLGRRNRERTPFGQRLFDARTQAQMTQPQLAKAAGMSQSTLAEAEYTAQGSSYTAQLAAALGVRSEWLATGEGAMKDAPDHLDRPMFSRRPAEPSTAYGMEPILAWEHPEDLPEGEFVMIPRLDVHLSAGGGREQVEIELVKENPQAFRAEWIRLMRLKPGKLAAMRAAGDSMEPTIHDGDSLLVDTAQTAVVDGKVYALWYDGGERVKRLFRLPGGGLRIKSDNAAFDTIELGSDYGGFVRIIGRVVHRSGTGGL
jgi:phage repressor protein C with HTH and peptisase S24 domain